MRGHALRVDGVLGSARGLIIAAREMRLDGGGETTRNRLDVVAIGVGPERVAKHGRHRGFPPSHRQDLDAPLGDAVGHCQRQLFWHHADFAEAGDTTAIRKSPSTISCEIARISESPMWSATLVVADLQPLASQMVHQYQNELLVLV